VNGNRAIYISEAELARRLGVSRAYVTQLLGGKPNMTLATLAKIAIALDCEVQTTLRSAARQHSDGSTTVESAHVDVLR
jgi:transcriptional regulator with XRE-family HTH domain